MKSSAAASAAKFGAFALAMAVLTVFLFMTFGQIRTGSTTIFKAVFTDASDLKAGQSVRVAGARVGTVEEVELGEDSRHVTVAFNVDNNIRLTTGTRASVRYLNLVGDRYLELLDGPGSTKLLQPGSVIPLERTSPALDLDLLLGGLRPVIQGLNADDVNALTSSLVQIMQGQQGNIDSLLTKTSSFTSTLADNSQVIEQLIDNLKDSLKTVGDNGKEFSATVDRLEQFVSQLSDQREPVGAAITALDQGTASIADLLTQARPPLAGTIDQLNRMAPNLDDEKDRLESALQKAPENYRKLVRTGAYGNFIQYFLCGLTIRVNDPTGKVLVLPVNKPNFGRCKDA
ncbi:MCE family protein [Mycobacterium sp. 48b]|uniref:MCE family protein n=1 Tax=Mycobacterium sp. 48b TaxID=3400426 RepID=UPI003AAD0EA3